MSNSKKILFVTGTRADFGKLKPLIVATSNAGYITNLFATGMHMLKRYGMTKIEVHNTPNVSVQEFLNQRPGDSQDSILIKTLSGFTDYLAEHQPDLVVVHGDRVEALACSLACAINYVPCAHIEGGEVSGTIDEVYRHCITKLSSHHFVSSSKAAQRVKALGESSDAIYVIGSPELDSHATNSPVDLADVRQRYNISFPEYGICIFHPVTSELATIEEQALVLFEALEKSNKSFVVILPNNDPGSEFIFDIINRLPSTRFRVLPSMRFSFFSTLLKFAACFIGNSSAGVREAPFLGVPSLDIGTRQANRSNSESIQHCSASDVDTIFSFLKSEWGRRYPQDPSFGTGNAAQLFIRALEKDGFWQRPLQKTFSDIISIV